MVDGTRMSWIRREVERRVADAVALERRDFAKKLRQLREQHDPPMNQEQAAHFIGAPARTYTRWELEEVDASLKSREKIAAAYGISPQELITEPDDEIRVTHADFTRLERKVDRALGILEALAGAPETDLGDAVRAIGAALAAHTPPTGAQPQAAPDTPKQAPAANRRRPARAAGTR